MKEKTIKLFTDLSAKIGDHHFSKVLLAVYLFDFLDRLRLNNFPSDWLALLEAETKKLLELSKFLKNSFERSLTSYANVREEETQADFAAKTGEVYFNLWKDFKQNEYCQQTLSHLKERLEKNKLSLSGIDRALDAGCGSGRYSLALKDLGCRQVIGLDISRSSIDLAKKMSPFSEQEVAFRQGSVLELPFPDKSFDLVFSNGVLHHTASTERGLAEIWRVLKPGGKCWLYIYGGKGSFFWDMVDFCRSLLKTVPQAYTQAVMKVLGYPAGRIFHRTDFWYVPVNRRYYASEVEIMLKDAGFVQWRRLTRGISYGWDEIIYNNPQIDPYIYGEGEMRYWVEK